MALRVGTVLRVMMEQLGVPIVRRRTAGVIGDTEAGRLGDTMRTRARSKPGD